MKINYTNQIRFLLDKAHVLIDIFYDNSKGMCHALKHAKVKAYKPVQNIDGTVIYAGRAKCDVDYGPFKI